MCFSVNTAPLPAFRRCFRNCWHYHQKKRPSVHNVSIKEAEENGTRCRSRLTAWERSGRLPALEGEPDKLKPGTTSSPWSPAAGLRACGCRAFQNTATDNVPRPPPARRRVGWWEIVTLSAWTNGLNVSDVSCSRYQPNSHDVLATPPAASTLASQQPPPHPSHLAVNKYMQHVVC